MSGDGSAGKSDAHDLARSLLWPLGSRWKHTKAVAARAEELAGLFAEADRPLLLAAAWLHDIGYAPDLTKTGFHPLDGARYLAEAGYEPRLCALVAHHSAARFEAQERGLRSELAAYPLEDSAVMDALVRADMTAGPHGEQVSLDERIDEILTRYPPETVVHRAIARARPTLALHLRRLPGRVELEHSPAYERGPGTQGRKASS